MIKVNRRLATARRQRGVIRVLVTEFETLAEAIDLSDVDRLTVQHLLQKFEKSDVSFKEFLFRVLDTRGKKIFGKIKAM